MLEIITLKFSDSNCVDVLKDQDGNITFYFGDNTSLFDSEIEEMLAIAKEAFRQR